MFIKNRIVKIKKTKKYKLNIMADKKVSKLKIKGTDYVIYDASTYQFAETRLAGDATVNGQPFTNNAVTIGTTDISYSPKETVADKFVYMDETVSALTTTVATKVAGADSHKSFQDKTGKYFTLTIDVNHNVVLTEVVYHAPTITCTNSTWASSSNLVREVDSEGSTGSVTKPFETTITVTNGDGRTPTTTTQGITLENISTGVWKATGDVAVANDGLTKITFSATGAENNPSLGDRETVNAAVTISRQKLVDVGYASNANRNATLENNSNGFVCKMNGTAQQLTESTGYKDGATQTAENINGYLYIFSRTRKSFAISASKSTIDGTKLAGGALHVKEVNLYSTNAQYYVYRSLKSFTGTVYFKAIV